MRVRQIREKKTKEIKQEKKVTEEKGKNQSGKLERGEQESGGEFSTSRKAIAPVIGSGNANSQLESSVASAPSSSRPAQPTAAGPDYANRPAGDYSGRNYSAANYAPATTTLRENQESRDPRTRHVFRPLGTDVDDRMARTRQTAPTGQNNWQAPSSSDDKYAPVEQSQFSHKRLRRGER